LGPRRNDEQTARGQPSRRPAGGARAPLQRASALAVTIVLPLLAACGAPAGPAAAPPAATTSPASQPAAPVALASPVAPAAAPTRTTLKFGGQLSLSDAGIFLALERGYLAEAGVDVEYLQVGSASDVVPPLATGELDLGGVANNPATLNAAARGVGFKLVADKSSMPPGFGSNALLVRKDHVDSGRFRDAPDLRGMTIGTTPPLGATVVSIGLDRILRLGGLSETDVDVRPLSFADINSALAGGAIDAAVQIEPATTVAVAQGLAVRWMGFDEIMPYAPVIALAYSPLLIRDRPRLAREFMVAYLRGVRDYNDAFVKNVNRAEAVGVLIKHTPIKDPTLYDRMVLAGLNPDGYINLEGMRADQEWFLGREVLRERVDLDTLVDHQYVEYALGRLGRYQP
jgi:NitT/TauT family transport system substrate-binding protein